MFSINGPTVRKHRNYPLRVCFLFGCVLFLANHSQVATAVDQESLSELAEQARVLKSQWREASLRSAIAKYREAEAKSQEARNYELAAEMARNAGDVYFLLSEYQNALQQYRAAQAFSQRARNRWAEMRASNLIGYVHVYLGKNQTALDLALAALRHYQNHQSDGREAFRSKAEAENCAGEAHASLGKLHRSIEHFDRALDLWTDANDKSGQALATLNLAYAYGDSGDIQKAQDLFNRSLSFYQAEGDKRGEALVLTAQGTRFSFLGEKQTALDMHLKAMELLRPIGDRGGQAVVLNSIGKAYEDLNDLSTALDNYKQALNLYQQLGNIEFASATKYYIGRTYKLMNDERTALQFFRESVADSQFVGQRRVTAYALTAISAIQSKAGKKDEARSQLQEAVRLYQKIGDRRGRANALNELATIGHAANQNARALVYHKQALDLYGTAGDKHGEAATLYKMAVVEGALGNLANALSHVKKSYDAIEILRSQVVSPDLRASYFASVRKYAELYIDLEMRLGQSNGDKSAPERAFEISEHAHSRSLLEVLGEAAAQIRQGVNPALLEQERVLKQKLNAQALHRMRLLENPDPIELEAVARDIRELTTSYRELETQMKQQSPRYANLVQPQPLSLKRIQEELSEGTVLLEFTLGTERSYLWAITNESLTAYTLPPRDEIESLVKSVCALLVARQAMNESDLSSYGPRVAQADAEYWQQADRLSEMLLGPVIDVIKGRTILVVADGALHYLPFQALPAPGTSNNLGSPEPVPLIVNHEIVSLPSASILATIRQTSRTGYNAEQLVAILADPVFSVNDSRVKGLNSARSQQTAQLTDKISLSRLPATQQEAQSIMAIIPAGTGLMATGFDANRTMALSSKLGQYKIVHLATHGVVDVENPELSGVVLSMVSRDGKSSEGLLQLHDIYNMNLSNTQLVVLSACETALGKEVRGEGLVGLSRGFIYAGASSVVATLWKVDDRATNLLMTQFYKGLFEEGLTAPAALRKAKLSMWQQPRYRAPFYWAAFELQGEYREQITVSRRTQFVTRKLLLTVLISVSVAVLILVLMRRRARQSHA